MKRIFGITLLMVFFSFGFVQSQFAQTIDDQIEIIGGTVGKDLRNETPITGTLAGGKVNLSFEKAIDKIVYFRLAKKERSIIAPSGPQIFLDHPQTVVFDMSGYGPGEYFIYMWTDEASSMAKFIIK